MSTHNIGFYEDLTKIIFELSSNIIKYAPCFFCWVLRNNVHVYIYKKSALFPTSSKLNQVLVIFCIKQCMAANKCFIDALVIIVFHKTR